MIESTSSVVQQSQVSHASRRLRAQLAQNEPGELEAQKSTLRGEGLDAQIHNSTTNHPSKSWSGAGG